MDAAQSAAYIIAQAACVTAEIAAMEAANQWRRDRGVQPTYDEEHFRAVPEKYGVHHNAVLTLFEQVNR